MEFDILADLLPLLASLYNFARRRIRRSRLKQYAESHGCSFCAEDDGGFAISRNILRKSPSKYKYVKATNIIQGSTQGLRFTYFEKSLIETGGDSAGEAVETRSIVAIDCSANDHFESGKVFDKDLVFYRENGKICFWWNDINSRGAIPVKKLEQWLADIASTFRTGK